VFDNRVLKRIFGSEREEVAVDLNVKDKIVPVLNLAPRNEDVLRE
jgi:hypothetical protein